MHKRGGSVIGVLQEWQARLSFAKNWQEACEPVSRGTSPLSRRHEVTFHYLSVPLQCEGARWFCDWCGAGVAGACGVCGVLRQPVSRGASPLAPSSFNLDKKNTCLLNIH